MSFRFANQWLSGFVAFWNWGEPDGPSGIRSRFFFFFSSTSSLTKEVVIDFNCGSFAVALPAGGPSAVRAARSLNVFLHIVFRRRWTGRQQQRRAASPLRTLPRSSRGRWWWWCCFGHLWCFLPLTELVRLGHLWRQLSGALYVDIAASLRRPSGSRCRSSSSSLPSPSPPSLCFLQLGLPPLLVQLQ